MLVPDRPFTEYEIAVQARDAGYRGLVLKSIFSPNADRIEALRPFVPGIELFGSVVLNHSVGGLNPAGQPQPVTSHPRNESHARTHWPLLSAPLGDGCRLRGSAAVPNARGGSDRRGVFG